jgi:hypothetical protein
VTDKREWPDWTPPGEMLQRRPDLPRHMARGPDNPMDRLPIDCSSLRSEQVALTSFGPLPR